MSSGVTVAWALQYLGLTRLTHFTPAMNLYHIVEDGQIVSSKELAEHAADYFSPTDRQRFDEHPDKVCCNFEYPNGYYLAEARKKPQFTNYPDWVCLLLDPVLLTRPGALFCVGNAAKGRGRHAREGGKALLDCFAPVSPLNPKYFRGTRHHPRAATDLQAEALIPGPIDLSHLRGIVLPCEDAAQQLHGVLRRQGLAPERFRWIAAPVFFDTNSLSRMKQYGGIVTETPWLPPADQESS
ncbi:MAG: DUF4433 domain-containing protein [Actinomycetota bacterium]|nr:DUF4433 domain-containing protein [Actinomycetota bacterium]